MINKPLFLSPCCFLLIVAQVSYSPIPGLNSGDYSYGGLISTEILSTVTFSMKAGEEWTLADIAQLYYGYEDYWPLLRAANPSLLRGKSSSYWITNHLQLAPLPTPNNVLIPSLLTCVEFMPLTCINNALLYFNTTSSNEIQYLSLVELSDETENMRVYVNNILGMNILPNSYNALTSLQIALSWTTNTAQTLKNTMGIFASPAMVFAMQAYHMNVENPTIINVTLLNKGTLDFSNAILYQPEGMGMTSVPGPLLSQNGSTTVISVESNDLRGTSGLLQMGMLQNSPTTGPALQIYWEIKNSDIFPNKIGVNIAKPKFPDLSSNFDYKEFDSDYLVDESITGTTLILTGYDYEAIVQITNARVRQVVITFSQNSLGKVYDLSHYYAIMTYPNASIPTQGLWFSPPESSQLFTGLLQYEVSFTSPIRNTQWKFFQVKPNIYNVWNLCSGIYIQADSAFNLLSFTYTRTGNTDIQWNLLPAAQQGFVRIQSVSLPNQCLTASPNLDGDDEGVHDLPIYLSDCSMIDRDQMFSIHPTNSLGPTKSVCTLSDSDISVS